MEADKTQTSQAAIEKWKRHPEALSVEDSEIGQLHVIRSW